MKLIITLSLFLTCFSILACGLSEGEYLELEGVFAPTLPTQENRTKWFMELKEPICIGTNSRVLKIQLEITDQYDARQLMIPGKKYVFSGEVSNKNVHNQELKAIMVIRKITAL